MARMRAQRGQVVLVQVGVEPERLAPARRASSSAARSSPVTLGTLHERGGVARQRVQSSAPSAASSIGPEPSRPGPSSSARLGASPDDQGMHTPLIEVRALDRRFGPRAALSGVDLVVGPGRDPRADRPARRGQDDAAARPRRGARRRAPGSSAVPARHVGASGAADRGAAGRRRIARRAGPRVAGAPDVLLVDEPRRGLRRRDGRGDPRARRPPRRRRRRGGLGDAPARRPPRLASGRDAAGGRPRALLGQRRSARDARAGGLRGAAAQLPLSTGRAVTNIVGCRDSFACTRVSLEDGA